MSKQVSLPKIGSILQEIKIGPISDIRPFCTEAFNYEHAYSLNCTPLGPNYYNLFFSFVMTHSSLRNTVKILHSALFGYFSVTRLPKKES